MNRYKLFSALDLMKKFSSQQFVHNYAMFAFMEGMIDETEKAQFPDGQRNEIKAQAAGMLEICKNAGMVASVQQIDRLTAIVEYGMSTRADIRNAIGQTQSVISDELQRNVFLQITPDKIEMFENPIAGWEGIIEAFQSSHDDIQEARKCFALDRYTAAVMHMMRAMGPGIAAVAKQLGTPEWMPTWDAYIRKFREAYRAKFSADSDEGRHSLRFYERLELDLSNIKSAWRNEAMHAAAAKYTEEDALEVFGFVKAFMRKVAEQFPKSQEQP